MFYNKKNMKDIEKMKVLEIITLNEIFETEEVMISEWKKKLVV